jgi:hypothetical protein
MGCQEMKIARVFPRKTKASPTDELAFYDEPGLFPKAQSGGGVL